MEREAALPREFLQTYQNAETIFSLNMPGKEMYIVYSGKVNLYNRSPSGGSEFLKTIEAGDFFGEMALVDDSPRSATAVAAEENTQLLVLDKNKFMYLLRNQPDFALVIMGKLCWLLRNATTPHSGWS